MSEYNVYKRNPERTELSSVVKEQEGRTLQCCLVPETPEKPLLGRQETEKVYSRKKLATQEKDYDTFSSNEKNTLFNQQEMDYDKPFASCVTMKSSAKKNVVFTSSLAITDEEKKQSSDRSDIINLGSGDSIDLNMSLDSRVMIDLNVGLEDEQSFDLGLIDLNSSKEHSPDGTRGYSLESTCSTVTSKEDYRRFDGIERTCSGYAGLIDLNKSIHSLENVMQTHQSESTFIVSDAGVNILSSGEMNNGNNSWNSVLSLGFTELPSLPKPEASQIPSQILNQETDTEKLSSNQNGENGIMDSKKSQQKTRKKKHRPQVLMDGKGTIRKPATPKQVREKKPRRKSKSSGLKEELLDKINAETKAPVARALDFQLECSESLDVVSTASNFPWKSLDTIYKKRRSKRRRKLNLFNLYVTINDNIVNWGRRKRRIHKKPLVSSLTWGGRKSRAQKSRSKILEKDTKAIETNVSIDNATLFSDKQTKASIENAAVFVANHELEVHDNAVVVNNDAPKGMEVSDSAMKGKRKRKANAITKPKGQELQALHVNDDGALVPYQGPFDPTKKKKWAKVELDSETLRVWNLLMNTDDDRSEEKASEENEKWWEKEREVFAKRVFSFLARMDKIQGDRSFRKWNGSVLDSVVGVFLTQNAADYLSSNAFMSLVSKFPSQPCQNSSCDEVLGTTNSQESAMEAVQTEHYLEGNQYFVREPTPERNEDIDGIEETSSMQTEDITSVCKPNSLDRGLQTTNRDLPEPETEMGKASDAIHGFKEEMINFQSQNMPVGEPPFPIDNVVQSQNSKMQDDDATIRDKKNKSTSRGKKRISKEEKDDDYWESLRLKYSTGNRGSDQMDAVDWEAVRLADVNEVASAIEVRGQHTVIATKIQKFLNRLIRIHKCLDLEWLRNTPPDKAKEYLLAVYGLGLKSVECVRLLSLRQVAFPVDTNVARIAVRLGWVPLKPLPGELQLHLLEQYPILDSIQIYLWPRLCTLPKETLYKLHTQMIGFGKVFCSKINPNCNACPMRADCRHFASAYASAMNALPGPASSTVPEGPIAAVNPLASVSTSVELPLLESGDQTRNCEPIIEEVFEPSDKASSTVPESPTSTVNPLASVSSSEEIPHLESRNQTEFYEPDIEDLFRTPEKSEALEDEESETEFDSQGIPIIKVSISHLKTTLLSQMNYSNNMFEDGYNSKALVALTSEEVSIPVPKLKNISRLRTEHLVYELPRNHPLLDGLEQTKSNKDVQYHLAIWSPGETADSYKPPEKKCNSTESEICNDPTCYSCNSIREHNASIVRGTLLIPCRVANRYSFPLNGTYFQDNEVFADHETSLRPFIIRRELIYNLPRRIAYFGSSISAITRALSTREIQQLFWKGIVCVRGFERSTRAPKPLVMRFHCKQTDKKKEKQGQKSGKRSEDVVKEKTQETDVFTR